MNGLRAICVPQALGSHSGAAAGRQPGWDREPGWARGLSWRHPPAEHLSAPWVVSIGLGGSRPAVTGFETSAVRGDVLHLPKCTHGLPRANTCCRIFPKADQDMKEPFKADAAE